MSPRILSGPVTSNAVISRPLTAVISPRRMTSPAPASTDQAIWDRVARSARCADGGLDPDEWFPISADAGMARQQAAAAIAVCATCPVRGQCLALSLRHWDIGQHGVWGGLVAADRAQLRARLRAGRPGRPRGSPLSGMLAQPSCRGHLAADEGA
jgi:Transcription factor WhiB